MFLSHAWLFLGTSSTLLLIILILASSGQISLLEDPTGGFPEGSHYRDHSHLTQRQQPAALRTSVSLWATEGKWASMENRQLFQAVTFPPRHWCKVAGKKELDPLYSSRKTKLIVMFMLPLFRWHVVQTPCQPADRIFSSSSVANVHVCFQVGRICPWVVFDLEEINPRVVTHTQKR